MELLQARSGGRYADLTFGEGGHTGAMLEAGAASVLAFDRDPEALRVYREGGKFASDPRLELVHSRFSKFSEIAQGRAFDGILVDLGVSTRQLLRPERGFSFSQEGPIDMRMNGEGDVDLLTLLGDMDADSLADALRDNADLPNARSLARRLLADYQAGRLHTTLDLARVAGPKHGKTHPATVLFLALRMLVNEEMREIREGLEPLLEFLVPGGRLVVITFHSSEDRVVKRLFQRLAGRCICDQRICTCPRVRRVDLITRKPWIASEEELRENPRSRSAKLRCVEKPRAEG